LGNDYRYLIPGSALMGAALMLASDVLSRVLIAPAVLPIGALTSFLGAPLFLYIIVKGNLK
jgi:iron complex transport system permease protein